jgi:acetyl-CoA synthetase
MMTARTGTARSGGSAPGYSGPVLSGAGFSGPLPPRAFNMAAYAIGRAAVATPDKAALVVVADPKAAPSEIWSFAALDKAVRRCAGGLRALNLAPQARVLIRLDNTSDYALLFFGCIAAGLVPIPASTQLTAPEVEFLLANSGAEVLAVADDAAPVQVPNGVRVVTASEVRRLIETGRAVAYAMTRADDPAFLVYTSGTTASPKGVLHAQRSAWGRRPMYDGWYGITPRDRVMHAGAFNWTYTLGVGLTDPWANGATTLIYTGVKDPGLWPDLISRHNATIFAAVPGLYRQILKYAKPGATGFGGLRHGLTAGEAPPAGFFEEWTGQTRLALYEALGMSELSTFVSTSPTVARRAGAIGRPQPGRSVAILAADGDSCLPLGAGQEGLLAVHRSDPGLMLGYWNRPVEQAEVFRGDWFIGGDLAVMDADGYVTHAGRSNDIMKAMGYRVAPQEVEAVLALHPDVAEVACREVLVRADVSVIGAYIVPKPGATPDAEAILAFAAERLAAYKRPRQINFVDALPRTANGKIRRAALGL